jgi:hypothetical protein
MNPIAAPEDGRTPAWPRPPATTGTSSDVKIKKGETFQWDGQSGPK